MIFLLMFDKFVFGWLYLFSFLKTISNIDLMPFVHDYT